jgi:hypothetical protein
VAASAAWVGTAGGKGSPAVEAVLNQARDHPPPAPLQHNILTHTHTH